MNKFRFITAIVATSAVFTLSQGCESDERRDAANGHFCEAVGSEQEELGCSDKATLGECTDSTNEFFDSLPEIDSDACIDAIEEAVDATVACTQAAATCDDLNFCAFILDALDQAGGPCHTGEPGTGGSIGEGGFGGEGGSIGEGGGGQGGAPPDPCAFDCSTCDDPQTEQDCSRVFNECSLLPDPDRTTCCDGATPVYELACQ